MLADKIRLLEEAADRAKAADAELGRIKDLARSKQEEARVDYEAVVAACKGAVETALRVHQEALKDVDRYKGEVRGFIDDIMQVGRVRQ